MYKPEEYKRSRTADKSITNTHTHKYK